MAETVTAPLTARQLAQMREIPLIGDVEILIDEVERLAADLAHARERLREVAFAAIAVASSRDEVATCGCCVIVNKDALDRLDAALAAPVADAGEGREA